MATESVTPLQSGLLRSRSLILTGTIAYTVPAGTRAILVECVAAGGGGGGAATAAASAACGGGGGGGAYAAIFIANPKLTAYVVAVGVGGTPGSGAGTNGTAGGDTSFDTGPNLALAKGGLGGSGEAAAASLAVIAGGLGGDYSIGIGTVLIGGGPGGYGTRLSGLVGASGQGGNGGALGGGGGVGLVNAGAGGNGNQYGGGGAGGLVLNGSASVSGGAGGNGVIVVWEFA